jgi:Bacterial extracellular solute-binding proteins, family 3
MLRHTCFCFLLGGSVFAQTPATGTLTVDPAQIQKPWIGDLDGIIERGVIRVLTVNSKTFYFHDKERSAASSLIISNCSKTSSTRSSRSKKTQEQEPEGAGGITPLRRDELLPGLAAGKGDIAAANLPITPERQKLADFTVSGLANVSEVAVSGPGSPKIASLDELSGKEVFVRKSSSYYESLVALNKKFASEKKSPVTLKEAPENLEDEDLLECSTPGLSQSSSSTSTRRTSGSRFSPSSLCTITSRCVPAVKSRGRSAKAVRSSRRRWTISPPDTGPEPRPVTNS